MKFKKDGKVFEDIEAARSNYCHNKIHCDGCALGKEASKPINACYYMAQAAPKQAAHLMGYEVVGDKSCVTCARYEGGGLCKSPLTGNLLYVDPELGCHAWEEKEADMDKPKPPQRLDAGEGSGVLRCQKWKLRR